MRAARSCVVKSWSADASEDCKMIEIEKTSEILLDECKRLEPCSAEVCADDYTETKIVYENTDFSVASSSQASVIGLRVITGNRLGFITTNSQDEKDLREKAREAQMIARLSPESPFHDIAPKQKVGGLFTMWDEKLANVQPKDLLKWTQLLIEEARKDERVAIDRAEVSVNVITRLVQNSNGVFQKVKQATCGWYIMGMARSGDEVTSFDYDGDSTQWYSNVEEKIRISAKEFRESVLGSLGASGAKSYRGPVLFHPAAVGSLIASVIGFNVNARAQQDGMSQWAGKLGTKVASELFTFIENPLDETRPASWTPFDREGALTAKHEIIKSGVLNFTAHNTFTAKRAKTSSTGNAAGGSRTVPSIGLHALTVAPGKTAQQDLFNGLNNGLVLKRFSGNSDPVSGQFSGVAKNSWWVTGGKRSHALKEVMISGNMFELLQNVKQVGSEIFRQGGSLDAPYLLIDGVSVTSS
jgi:PmbA protein